MGLGREGRNLALKKARHCLTVLQESLLSEHFVAEIFILPYFPFFSLTEPPINPTDPPTDPTTDPPTGHPACRPGTTYDAVVVEEDTSGSQFTHFFHGDSFWTLSRRLQKSQAKKVKDYYPEVRTPISAAYRNKQGYVVIFSGSR